MPRLIVHPDTSRAVEIPLVRGVTTLGRNTENHHAFDDPSVSGTHFQLSVTNAGTIVRDLGSTNGTFVDGNRIEESILLPGQTIRAGEVTMRFEADYETTSAAPNRSTKPSDEPTCFNHPKNRARYLCPACQGRFCEQCALPDGRNRRGRLCLVCRGECIDLEPPESKLRTPESFARQTVPALSYPLHGNGFLLMAGGAFLYGIMGSLRGYALYGGFVVSFLAQAYLMIYAREILRRSANGEPHLPPWPDITRSSDYRNAFLEFYAAGLLCFAPVTVVGFLHSRTNPWHGAFMVLASIPGLLYLPMALTAITLSDSFSGMNPRLVLPSIWRTRRSYLILLVTLGLIIAVAALSDVLLRWLQIPLLPRLLGGAINIYVVAVAMRLCGLFYRTEEAKLAWF